MLAADAACNIHDRRPCEMKTLIGWGLGIAEETHTPLPPTLKRIEETGKATECDVYKGLRELEQKVPAEWKTDVQNIVFAGFGKEGDERCG